MSKDSLNFLLKLKEEIRIQLHKKGPGESIKGRKQITFKVNRSRQAESIQWMLRNVSQADVSAEAFISSGLDVRKMMLSKYLPFTLPQAAVSQLVVQWM